jgi:hypothetical protein
MPMIALKMFLKSKVGKYFIGICLLVLIMYVMLIYNSMFKLLCMGTFGLYDEGCNETTEVLTYEPIEDKDMVELGTQIFNARFDASKSILHKEVEDFLENHDIGKKSIDVTGETYRTFSYDGTEIVGGGGGSLHGGGRVYNPSYVEADYWEWALDVSSVIGWSPLFIMAQWRDETGNFSSPNFVNNNNIAGQTWTPNCGCLKGTPRPKVEGGWYIKYEDAAQGYIDFIQKNSRYDHVKNLKTPEEQAKAVAEQGWAVAPDYLDKLLVLIEETRKKYGDVGIQAPGSRDFKSGSGTDFTNDSNGLGRKYNTHLGIHPFIEKFANELVNVAKDERGLTIKVMDGYRSSKNQQKAYDEGNSKALPGYSWHNWGQAVDIVPTKNGQPSWDEHIDDNGNGINDWDEILELGKTIGGPQGFINLYDVVGWDRPHWEHNMGMTFEGLIKGEVPNVSSFSETIAKPVGDKIKEIAKRYKEEMGTGQSDPDKRVQYDMEGGKLKKGGKANNSDFTRAVYKEAGIDITGDSYEQMFESEGEFVDGIQNLLPGDLVFFNPPKDEYDPVNGKFGGHGVDAEYQGSAIKVSHVGVYIGGSMFVHLSFGKNTIDSSAITSDIYSQTFIAGKRWGKPGEDSFQPSLEGKLNEAELHLRAISQVDWNALDYLELTEETMEEEPFVDSKMYKTWLVAKEMKRRGELGLMPYSAVVERSESATDSDGIGQNWLVMNWIAYTQQEVYKCYFLGDEEAEGVKGWFANLFGGLDKPCETLDELYASALGVDNATFVDREDRGKVKQQHAIIEENWSCPTTEEVTKTNVDTGFWKKINNSGLFKTVNFAFAQDKNEVRSAEKPKCKDDAEPISTKRATTHLTHKSLLKILNDFEKYSMYELGVTFDEIDGTYSEMLERVLSEFYRENTRSEDWVIMPSTDWIVPMEFGTYNYASGYMSAARPTHYGVDMGSGSVPRIPVYASATGEVISAGPTGTSYGSIVVIDHKTGIYSLYAHFWEQDIVVKAGDKVSQGQLIGGAGNDSNTFNGQPPAWHLHFEICQDVRPTKNGAKICSRQQDPNGYISGLSTNQNIELTRKRANQFTGSQDYTGEDGAWNKMAERARQGEQIFMPGFAPSNEFIADINPGEYEKHPIRGNILGGYRFSEKKEDGKENGNLYDFGDFLIKDYPSYYEVLSPYDPSSDSFVERWKKLAKEETNGFAKAQQEFEKSQ